MAGARDDAVLRELRAIRLLLEQRLPDEPGPAVPMMSVEEAAAYLGVPMNTLYQWRTQRVGPRGYRVGKYVRYRRAEIDAWLLTVTEGPMTGRGHVLDPASLPPATRESLFPPPGLGSRRRN